jgi:23S rRNA (uracil1939-C5)-methyltransferase
VVVVDPPRKGLNADTIEALHRMGPRRIVYVSCDPATLARDVALLKERGYALKNAMAADLFPRCAHVESVVTLLREKVDGHINISLDVEELGEIPHVPIASELSEKKQKPKIAERKTYGVATYPQIKEYIFEKYGLKVPSSYIAQVKTECGIKERENYNLGKEGGRKPSCTPEKREAIMDAFRHFHMITG